MFFKVLYQSKKSRARLGKIITSHGTIKTPAFVPVATKGTIKALTPLMVKEIGIQTAFVNTYHLLSFPGVEVVKKAGGIHRFCGLNIPLMSDSGGFQVFSLARNRNWSSKFLSHDVTSSIDGFLGKRKKFLFPFFSKKNNIYSEAQPLLIKISDEGVQFRSAFDGRLIEITPEKSIDYQRKIGADILMAFDECIPYGVSYDYTKEATERTHRWLLRCIKKFKSFRINELSSWRVKKSKNSQNSLNPQNKIINNQFLYGIIQGGFFDDLRKKSAEFIVSQPVDGVAIGGVSVGESKRQMRDQVKWVSFYLPKDKPVHLLGVGQFDDILDLVKYGIDTFDCVEPTRLGRMGTIMKLKIKNSKLKIEKMDILKGKYRKDLSSVDGECSCFVCQNFTKSYLHHLFKNRELLAYTLATYHNLWVMEKLFELIREMIAKDLI